MIRAGKKSTRPTVTSVKFFCSNCNSVGNHYKTNEEIHSNITIKQWCKKCNCITEWIIKT